jgi:putative NAD(P)-binding protein
MVRHKKPETATVIGSGPNGLSAKIVLASGGLATTVSERNPQIGGACSAAETTLPNFLGSSAYPMEQIHERLRWRKQYVRNGGKDDKGQPIGQRLPELQKTLLTIAFTASSSSCWRRPVMKS